MYWSFIFASMLICIWKWKLKLSLSFLLFPLILFFLSLCSSTFISSSSLRLSSSCLSLCQSYHGGNDDESPSRQNFVLLSIQVTSPSVTVVIRGTHTQTNTYAHTRRCEDKLTHTEQYTRFWDVHSHVHVHTHTHTRSEWRTADNCWGCWSLNFEVLSRRLNLPPPDPQA